jgi:hypothetical protein
VTRFRPYAVRAAERREEAAATAEHYSDGPYVDLFDDEGNAKPASCGLCTLACTTDDYCHGCKTVVCANCDPRVELRPTGKHAADAHLPRAKALS